MTHVTCRLTAKNRDQLRNPTFGKWVWATFTFLSPFKSAHSCIWSEPPSHTRFLGPTHVCPQLASQSVQPFWHNSPIHPLQTMLHVLMPLHPRTPRCYKKSMFSSSASSFMCSKEPPHLCHVCRKCYQESTTGENDGDGDDIPSGCLTPGVIDRTKSSGVMSTSDSRPSTWTRSVAK